MSPGTAAEPAELADDRARIGEIAAILADGDADRIAAAYHLDGVQFLPMISPARGRGAIRSSLGDVLGSGRYRRTVKRSDVIVSTSRDFAVSYGSVSVSGWDHPILGETVGHVSMFVTILGRNDAGTWQVLIDNLTPERMVRETSGKAAASAVPAPPFAFRPESIYDWHPTHLSAEQQRDVATIRDHHVTADRNIAAGDPAGFAEFYDDGGMLITAGLPVATGRDAIRQHMARLIAIPEYGLPIRYHGTVVSQARDLAFTYGEIALVVRGKSFPGDFLIVYGRDSAGEWRGLLDITCPSALREGLLRDG